MDEMSKHGPLDLAALRAGMHRNTARRYSAVGKLPSELREPRSWRTREDPFVADWAEIAERLEAAPELEAKAHFEDQVRRHPERYEEGQLRTLQQFLTMLELDGDVKALQSRFSDACEVSKVPLDALSSLVRR